MLRLRMINGLSNWHFQAFATCRGIYIGSIDLIQIDTLFSMKKPIENRLLKEKSFHENWNLFILLILNRSQEFACLKQRHFDKRAKVAGAQIVGQQSLTSGIERRIQLNLLVARNRRSYIVRQKIAPKRIIQRYAFLAAEPF